MEFMMNREKFRNFMKLKVRNFLIFRYGDECGKEFMMNRAE